MYKRKRNKIVVIAVIIFLIWLILGIILYNMPTTPNDKLQKIGYSQLEADEITKRLSDKNINLLLKRKYSKKVVKIISDSNFKEKYFFTYLQNTFLINRKYNYFTIFIFLLVLKIMCL